jgi:hypothetical protein
MAARFRFIQVIADGKSKNQEKRENGHCRDCWIAHEEIHQVHVPLLRPVTGISYITMYGISTVK